MSEQQKAIPIPGTPNVIRGLFRDVSGSPIIVMLHCFTGNKNCLELYLGARAFESAGLSSFRFDLYGREADQRDFLDCTMHTHVDDLTLVIQTLRQEYPNRKIGVVGHSVGGAVILATGEGFDAAALWDCTHVDYWDGKPLDDGDHFEWVPSLGLFKTKGGVEELVSREYLESYRYLDSNKLISELHCPTMVVVADDGDKRWVSIQRRFYEHANEPKAFAAIEGANHLFNNDETMIELHQRTIDWLLQVL